MSRFGRRRFLASSAGVAAGAVGASSLGGTGTGADAGAATAADRPLTAEASLAAPPGLLRATGLTVNGLVDPVGVDPDGVSFAWTVQATGRSVMQSAYRLILRRTDPGLTGRVWTSGEVLSAQQAFVGYTGSSPLPGDASYEWTVQPRGYAERWGPPSPPARFTTSLRGDQWQGLWLRPAGGSLQPDRVTYLRTEVTPPAGGLARVTAYLSAAHTYRFYVNGAPVDAWPSFSYPDEQYAVGGRPHADRPSR